MLAINSETKTFKILCDETKDECYIKFILNTPFCSNFFKQDPECDEFYVKDELFTFYFVKIDFKYFFILFDKETPFDDINTVKTTLKTFFKQL